MDLSVTHKVKYSAVQSVWRYKIGIGSPHLARGFCGPGGGVMTAALKFSAGSNTYPNLTF